MAYFGIIFVLVLVFSGCSSQKTTEQSFAPDILEKLQIHCRREYSDKGPDYRFESEGIFFHCLSESKPVSHQNYRPAKHPQWKKTVCEKHKSVTNYRYQPGHSEMQCGKYDLAVAAALDELARLQALAQVDSYHKNRLNQYTIDAYELIYQAYWNKRAWANALDYRKKQRRLLAQLKVFHFTNAAHLYLLMDDTHAALQELEQAQQQFSVEKQLARIKKMRGHIEEFVQIKDKLQQSSQDPDLLLRYAQLIWQLNIYYSDALGKTGFLRILNFIIQSGHKVAKAYFLRAKYYLTQGDRAKANQDLDRSLRAGINNISNIYEIAKLHSKFNNPAASLQAAEQFRKVSPDERAYLLIGHANFELGRFSRALEAYNKALKLNRNPRMQVGGLGSVEHDAKWLQRRAYIFYTKGEFEEAIDELSKAIEQEAGDYTEYLYRAVVLNEMSDFHAAQKDLLVFQSKLPELDLTESDYGDYYHALGDNIYGLGDVAGACAQWEIARDKWRFSLVTSRKSLLNKIREHCQ